ncbi:MAG: NAD(P)/FAD-dependent oxidoreductase [Alicyclobacillus sp.]|nr:NAD(P)/FAD-dependent oxidoreductase [Alicyclobacillus sp.]
MANVVIVGAGYAGMLTATGLDRMGEPFTLINKNPYHYLTTLLHEAAGGRGDPMNYTVPIRQLLKKPSSRFVQDEVVKLDRDRRTVVGRHGEYPFDWLVVGVGWVPEYFGIPGLAEHSLVLRDIDTAIQIREHIEAQFASYLQDPNPSRLRIVIGGAGLTGIELLGELVDWIPELCTKYGVRRDEVTLLNIEAMPTILPQVSPELRDVAARTLTEKGAQLRTNTKIVQVTEGVVHLDGGEQVHAATIIWTGGVRAHPLLSEAGFTVDRRGRAKVDAYLRSVDDERVFVGGDAAWFEDEAGKPLPPTAQVATQMGHCLAENVSSAVHGHALKPFRASLKGTLASLGREVGVGNIGKLALKGAVASLAKEATKVKYLWELGGLRLTADKTGELVHIT